MAKNRKTPDMNLPMWFDGQNINEALFCEEFLQERRIIFANGAFFTPDGRVTDDLPLRGEIYDKLKFCAVNNIPRKITNILEVLKLEAQVPDFPPEQDRIHLSNGTLLLNGTFTIADDSVFTLNIAVPCTKGSINIFLRKRAPKLMELWIGLVDHFPVQTLTELRHIRIESDQLHILRTKNRTAHSGIALDDSIFTVRMTAGLSLIHI